ncbi:DUF3822 family protein [Aegicerativicinus sediminis]
MVTGLKTIQKNNNLVDSTDKALSIQVSLNGLSFCIQDNHKQFIGGSSIKFNAPLTPFKLLEQLELFIDQHKLQQEFQYVQIVFRNEICALVPEDYFNQDQIADYLKFNSKILKSDFIATDTIESIKAKNVYVPLMNIVNYLLDIYGSFEYRHSATILIDAILTNNVEPNTTKVYLHLDGTYFEMVVIKKGKLEFYNMFEFNTKEDLIYYVLFTMEQLKLDPENIPLEIIGNLTEEDDIFRIIYRYIRHVHLFQFEPSIDFQLLSGIENPYLLINSFSYANNFGNA